MQMGLHISRRFMEDISLIEFLRLDTLMRMLKNEKN